MKPSCKRVLHVFGAARESGRRIGSRPLRPGPRRVPIRYQRHVLIYRTARVGATLNAIAEVMTLGVAS